MYRYFIGPVLALLVGLGALYVWGGLAALTLTLFLSMLEISLSFDNAVVNAKILQGASESWRQRFLTWGMLFAVFGTRLIFPVLLVAVAAGVSPLAAGLLAIYSPEGYALLLTQAEPLIHAFGGAFLLMVSLGYFFDEAKSVHWIRPLEKRFAAWGRLEAIEVALTLAVLLVFAYAVPEHAAAILGAGSIGIVLFILIEGIIEALGSSAEGVVKNGLALFVYLNLLDAAFSLDGVIGAFALTSALPVIVVGLGIGAYFVRAFTVVLVKKGSLNTLIYLEHGAYWAIAALGFCMFAALSQDVPEVLAGTIGIVFLGSAYLSSLRVAKNTRRG